MAVEQSHHLTSEHWDLEEKSTTELQREYANRVGSQRFWGRTEFWGFVSTVPFAGLGLPALAALGLSTGMVADVLRSRASLRLQSLRDELKYRRLVPEKMAA